VVCVNQLTTPNPGEAGVAPLTLHQSGLFGIALTQGLILAVLLALTVPVSGGYLNPAVTVMLWAFGRMDSARAGVLLAAQLLGSVLAASCLRLVFNLDILQTARFGTPHVNPLAYPFLSQQIVLAGSGIEVVLTFFPGLRHLRHDGSGRRSDAARPRAWMVQAAAVLVGYR